MVHSRPRPARIYVVGSAAVLLVVLVLGAAVALYRQDEAPQAYQQDDAPQTAAQVTRDPRTLPQPTTPATICEGKAVQMLTRYALAVNAGEDTNLLIGYEQQYYGLNSPEFLAYRAVLNEYVTALLDPANQDAGLAAVVGKVMPVVRRVCARA